jgi:hypothetical protein
MAFSYTSANFTIEVTGTETIQSFFSSALNSPSGDNGTYLDRRGSASYYSYHLKTARRVIVKTGGTVFSITDGELIIPDPGVDVFQFWVENGGKFILGASTSTAEARDIARLVCLRTLAGSNYLASYLRFNGELELYGEIQSSSSIVMLTDGRLTGRNGSIKIFAPSGGSNLQVRIQDATTTYSNLQLSRNNAIITHGSTGVFTYDPSTNLGGTSGLNLLIPMTFSATPTVTLTGLSFPSFLFFQQANLIRLLNFRNPTVSAPSTSGTNNWGELAIFYTATILLNQSNCFYYFKDSNSGNRNAASSHGFNSNLTNSGQVSGSTLTLDVPYRVVWQLQNQVGVGDVRTPFLGVFAKYGYSLSNSSYSPTAAFEATATLLLDVNVTETNRATVVAYSGYAVNIGTSTLTLTDSSLDGERLYDWAAYWTETNLSSEFPGFRQRLIASNGTVLDAGALNIVVDGVTFGASTKFSELTTTGTVTFINGADYEVTVIDSTGTRYPAIAISGFPATNNSNGIAPAPKVALTNLRTSTTQTYTVSGATISLKLSDVGALPDDDVRITADAIGYIRPLDQTVKGNRTEPVEFIFSPWLNSKGQEIVGLESAAAIDFDLIEEQLLLPTGVVSFYGALMQWETVTAGSLFYLFPTDAVRRFSFIEGFDSSKRVVIADPWTIAAKPDDASSPIISDFVVLSETVSRDPFEHGLASTASGLTDRPEVVIAFQNPGTSVAVTSIAANAITAASVASDAVAEIQSGLATASQVGNIPTNPLLTTDSRLNNLDATIGSRLADADYTAPPDTTAIATAVEAALINEGDGQQLIDAILQVINSNLDLPALELTAIAQAVRTNLATELGRIDATISSRLADADYTVPTTPPTAAAIAAAVDASLLDNFAAIPTAPTASQNAAAVRTELATELGRIDATINSRSTPAQVTAAQSAVQGSISALNNLSQTQAQSAATAALNAYDPPTKAELDSGLAGLPTAAQIDTALLDNFAAIISALPPAPDNTGIASIKSKVDQITISSGKVSATLGGDPVVLPSDAVAKLTELWGLRGLDPAHPATIETLEQTYNGVTLTLVQSGSGQNAVVTITRS